MAHSEPIRCGGAFGYAHLIDVRPDGMLAGAADPRALISSAAGR
ncbi:hypothetical protein OG589_03700 [Sphaerisporangium sp. NBC_01403]